MTEKTNRRKFVTDAIAMSAGAMLSTTAFSTNQESDQESEVIMNFHKALPSLKDRTILFIWGGWKGHEPEKFVNFLVPWMEEQEAIIKVFNSLEPYVDKELMGNIDLILQVYTMSKITKEQAMGLAKAVKNGTGMAGWHGGMCDAFRQNTEYQFMTGGQWVAHPGNIIDYEVNIIDHEDDVTNGLKDFKMRSEQYFMHVDPNVKVLATTTFTGEHANWINGCVMPIAWKKMYGKGRIFYTSLGHNLNHVTEVPGALEIIKRGIKWASMSKYEDPEDWISAAYKQG